MVRKKNITTDLRQCSNCQEYAPVHQMLTVCSNNRTVCVLCSACQHAKKIQITLNKDSKGDWQYFQYFPVEA
jgi:hypothetical protein